MPVYTWYWEEEPDFMLPHARHITITDDEGGELCIIVVRNKFADDVNAVMSAEARAEAIVLAMSDDGGPHHMDDPRSHG